METCLGPRAMDSVHTCCPAGRNESPCLLRTQGYGSVVLFAQVLIQNSTSLLLILLNGNSPSSRQCPIHPGVLDYLSLGEPDTTFGPDHHTPQTPSPHLRARDYLSSLLFDYLSSPVPSTPLCHSSLRKISRLLGKLWETLKCPCMLSPQPSPFTDKLNYDSAG